MNVHIESANSAIFPFEKLSVHRETQLASMENVDPSALICLAVPNISIHTIASDLEQLKQIHLRIQDETTRMFFCLLEEHVKKEFPFLQLHSNPFTDFYLPVFFGLQSTTLSSSTTVCCYNESQNIIDDQFLVTFTNTTFPIQTNVLLQLFGIRNNQLHFFLMQCMVLNPVEEVQPSIFFQENNDSFFFPNNDQSSFVEQNQTQPVDIPQPSFSLFVEEEQTQPVANPTEDPPHPAFSLFVEQEPVANPAEEPPQPAFFDNQSSPSSTPDDIFFVAPTEEINPLENFEQAASELLPYDEDDNGNAEQEDEGKQVVIRSKYRARRRIWKTHLKSYFQQQMENVKPIVPSVFAKAWIPAITNLSSDEEDHSSSDDDDVDFEEDIPPVYEDDLLIY